MPEEELNSAEARGGGEGQPEPGPSSEKTQAAQAAPEGSAQAPPDAHASLDGEIARLRAELEEAKDRALRGWAELENYRKRVNRQIEEERRYAALPLLRDLLPVLDDVQRAVDAAEKSPDASGLLDGVKLVAQQLEGVLKRHHCTPIAALHRPFDPTLHEAILQQPSSEFPPNTVLEEVRRGFQLHDRVVRPTQVIVSAAAQGPSPSQAAPQAES